MLAVPRHDGTGSRDRAARLAPDPLPFDALSSFVRMTNRAMPAYSEQVLSNSDLAEIYAYLQSIPKGPDPKNIPLLNH
jgi:mono/diheme cytochrome c family protein